MPIYLKSTRFDLVRCEEIPEDLKTETFYYSEKYHTAAHLCPCGCGRKVVTPIFYPGEYKGRRSWNLSTTIDGLVTLSPSILSPDFPCKSHYYIRSSLVEWC